MPDKGAGLKQVGAAGAKTVRNAEVGSAAGQRKACQRERRKPIVGADARRLRCGWLCCLILAPHCRRWSASRHKPAAHTLQRCVNGSAMTGALR